MAATQIDPRFAPVVAAFAKHRDVTTGTMMSSHGLKVNGKIFAMCTKGRFVVKLPKVRVDEMVDNGEGIRFDPGHGRLMKEWLVVHAEPDQWLDLAHEAYRFVRGVPSRRRSS
jgi:TfoX/Sxy family transcriptional regulator of competence genes